MGGWVEMGGRPPRSGWLLRPPVGEGGGAGRGAPGQACGSDLRWAGGWVEMGGQAASNTHAHAHATRIISALRQTMRWAVMAPRRGRAAHPRRPFPNEFFARALRTITSPERAGSCLQVSPCKPSKRRLRSHALPGEAHALPWPSLWLISRTPWRSSLISLAMISMTLRLAAPLACPCPFPCALA